MPPAIPRASAGTGTRRECHHLRVTHVHGTRAAYVADRCRCPACREANRVEAAARTRALAYGRWRPFVDAARARAYIRQLRLAGLGIDQIAAMAAVPGSTIRSLVYGDYGTGKPVARIRPATETAILAVPASRLADGALVAAAPTHRLIGDLLQAGLTLDELSCRLGRTTASVRASLSRDRVTARTAAAVAALHRTTCATATQRPAFTGLRDLPRPAAADRVTSAPPDPDGATLVDQVAVERAAAGEQVPLTLAEQIEVVRRLSAKGTSVRRIALLLGTSARTVSRRKAAGAVA